MAGTLNSGCKRTAVRAEVSNECPVCALLHAKQECGPSCCTTAALAAAEQYYCRLRASHLDMMIMQKRCAYFGQTQGAPSTYDTALMTQAWYAELRSKPSVRPSHST